MWPMNLLNPTFNSRIVVHLRAYPPKNFKSNFFLKQDLHVLSLRITPPEPGGLKTAVLFPWHFTHELFALLVLSFFVFSTVFLGAPESHKSRPLCRKARGDICFPPTGLPAAVDSKGSPEWLEERNTEAHTNWLHWLPSLWNLMQRLSRFIGLKYQVTVCVTLRPWCHHGLSIRNTCMTEGFLMTSVSSP